MVQRGPAAGRHAHDGDLGLVAVEEVHVVLHPLQRKQLVVQPRVRDRVRRQRQAGPVEEAEVPDAVVDPDVHDGTGRVLQERDRVAHRLLRAHGVRAAEDPRRERVSRASCHRRGDTYQNRTGTLPAPPLRTDRGTITSRNRQSSS